MRMISYSQSVAKMSKVETTLTLTALFISFGIFIAHFSKDWTGQYYYDVQSDEFHIAVEESRREEALRCLEREFPPSVYKIVDPWPSSYQAGCDSPTEEIDSQQIQTELYPGRKIHKRECMQCVLFSGSIINREQGMTVAHAFDPGDEIEIQCESDRAASVYERIVGRCRNTFKNLQRQGGGMVTADLALLELDTERFSVGNTVQWPTAPGKTLMIRMCKEQRIPDETGVTIMDQNGNFRNGCIRREGLTDVMVDCDGGLHDVLGIGSPETEEAITQSGDSGALVMSLPSSESGSDVIYVYGIVLGIYKLGNERSLTIANSLWKVIYELSTNENYSEALTGDMQDIDFA